MPKLQFDFDDSAWEKILELQASTNPGNSPGEVIRDALALYYWALTVHREGCLIGKIRNNVAEQAVELSFRDDL